MRNIIIIAIIAGIFCTTFAKTNVCGDVSGVWKRRKSPYYVTDHIRIPSGERLIIQPGCRIIFKGTYYGFHIDSNATLIAVGTEKRPIYFVPEDESSSHHGIRFSYAAEGCSLSYCHIEGGVATGFAITDCGGGVICNHSNPTIANCAITGNKSAGTWGYGGGICCFNSNPIIVDNVITKNAANHYGGGIVCYDHSSPVIVNNVISSNSSRWGGGIACYNNSNPEIIGNTFLGNTAEGGGAIFCESSNPIIADNLFANNSAAGSAGESWGGAIYCDKSSSALINNTITENSARYDGYGGAIFCWKASKLKLLNNIIWGNEAAEGKEIFIGHSSSDMDIPSPCTLFIAYTDLDTMECVVGEEAGKIIWGDGVLNLKPSFADTLYYLSCESACFGRGIRNIYIPLWDIKLEAPENANVREKQFEETRYYMGRLGECR